MSAKTLLSFHSRARAFNQTGHRTSACHNYTNNNNNSLLFAANIIVPCYVYANLQLRLCRVLPDLPEDGSELLGVDDAVVVGVEEAEGVLEKIEKLFCSFLRSYNIVCT